MNSKFYFYVDIEDEDEFIKQIEELNSEVGGSPTFEYIDTFKTWAGITGDRAGISIQYSIKDGETIYFVRHVNMWILLNYNPHDKWEKIQNIFANIEAIPKEDYEITEDDPWYKFW